MGNIAHLHIQWILSIIFESMTIAIEHSGREDRKRAQGTVRSSTCTVLDCVPQYSVLQESLC